MAQCSAQDAAAGLSSSSASSSSLPGIRGPNPELTYLLVAHGSSDPRPARALGDLAQRLNPLLPGKVAIAQLECQPLPLHQQIVELVMPDCCGQFSSQLPPSQPDPNHLIILPLFLQAGVHVMEDIPAELAQLRAALDRRELHSDAGSRSRRSEWQIELRSHLGMSPALHRLVTETMASQPLDAWILVAHGSRRAGANPQIAALAERLGATIAYWATEPKLEAQLELLLTQGLRRIGILPYFLFEGGISDAIAQMVQQFAQAHPDCQIHLASTLDGLAGLESVVVALLASGSGLNWLEAGSSDRSEPLVGNFLGQQIV